MSLSRTSVTDTYNDLLTTTLSKYMPKMVDNIFKGTPLLWWLNDKKRKRPQRGGFDIRIPVAVAENTTPQHFSGYDTVDITPQEGLTMLVYNWKNFVGSVSISNEEELKNQGQFKLLDLLGWKVDQLERSMRRVLNSELHGAFGVGAKTYTGGETNTRDSIGGTAVDTGYKSFNSLDHIIRSAWGMIDPLNANSGTAITHTVGGVTVSTTTSADGGTNWAGWGDIALSAYSNPWWMNQTNPGFGLLSSGVGGGVMGPRLSLNELLYAGLCTGSGSSGALQDLYLSYAMLEMYSRLTDEGDEPDLILTSPEVYNLYEMGQMKNERYTDRRVADAGFQNIAFKGCTMMADHGITTKLATASHSSTAPAVPMYFINSDYMWWVVHPDADFKQTPFVKPENQLARTAQVVLMGQLCCDNRRKQGHLSLASIATNGWNATS